MFKSRKKETVEIIYENTRKHIKKYKVVNGNTIELEPAKKGRGNLGKYAHFSPTKSYYYYSTKLGSLKRKLFLFDGASKCIEFNNKELDLNAPSEPEVSNLFDAKVYEKSGQVGSKVEVPIILYLMLGAVLIINVFMLMQFMGLVR